MSNLKSKPAATDEEISKLFEGIDEGSVSAVETTRPAQKTSRVPMQSPAEPDQLLAELDHLTLERPGSRSNTPKLPSSTARNTTKSPKPGINLSEGGNVIKESAASQRAPRSSAESSDSRSASFTPAASHGEADSALDESGRGEGASSRLEAPTSSGGGWLGSIFATATAAVKTAEAAVKEIQQNEEAKRWAEQVKGNVGALRGLGTCRVHSRNTMSKLRDE